MTEATDANGPLEVKVSGLVDSAERRIRQWQGVAAMLFIIMVVGAALAVVVVALRWDYERGRAVAVLQADLDIARARERCWEALARYTPRCDRNQNQSVVQTKRAALSNQVPKSESSYCNRDRRSRFLVVATSQFTQNCNGNFLV